MVLGCHTLWAPHSFVYEPLTLMTMHSFIVFVIAILICSQHMQTYIYSHVDQSIIPYTWRTHTDRHISISINAPLIILCSCLPFWHLFVLSSFALLYRLCDVVLKSYSHHFTAHIFYTFNLRSLLNNTPCRAVKRVENLMLPSLESMGGDEAVLLI